MIYSKLKFSIILLLIVISFSLSPTTRILAVDQVYSSSAKYFETSAKIGDYVEFNLEVSNCQKINNDSSLGTLQIFIPDKPGFLRWTVIGINGDNITLKIEISVNNFYSDAMDVSISNGMMYNSHNQLLGYNPFWIPFSYINQDNVSFGGTANNPVLGHVIDSNAHDSYLGGYRDDYKFANTNNFQTPGYPINRSIFISDFSKDNGLLVESYSPDIYWIPISFAYYFEVSSFALSNSNINFGPINYVFTILAFLASVWLPVLIIIAITLTIVPLKIRKWIRNRHA